MKARPLILLALVLPLSLAGFVVVDQVTAEGGSEIVSVRMNMCMDPGLHADDSWWEAEDLIPAEDWEDGTDLTARFDWKGDSGTLHTPHGDTDYTRLRRYSELPCAIG